MLNFDQGKKEWAFCQGFRAGRLSLHCGQAHLFWVGFLPSKSRSLTLRLPHHLLICYARTAFLNDMTKFRECGSPSLSLGQHFTVLRLQTLDEYKTSVGILTVAL
jgi:hypothetical protein